MTRIILFFSFHRERQNFVSENYLNQTPKNTTLVAFDYSISKSKYIIGYRIDRQYYI